MSQFTIGDLENSLTPRLRSIFFKNPSFAGSAISAAVTFEEWFRISGLPFFKEYTDHTFLHSLEVFKTSCEIISEDAYETLSSEDLVILFLACIVHDAGLHITEDMFFNLVDKSNSTIKIPQFDQTDWPTLWLNYIAEAKRFNEKRLISIFGDTTPVSEPPTKAIDLTNRDRLLIGEFLRRHHPRLAHEIAVGSIGGDLVSKSDRIYLETIVATLEKSGATRSSKRAFSIWKAVDNNENAVEDTIVSEVWNESFSSPLLPYETDKRQSVLKKNAPIKRFLT